MRPSVLICIVQPLGPRESNRGREGERGRERERIVISSYSCRQTARVAERFPAALPFDDEPHTSDVFTTQEMLLIE